MDASAAVSVEKNRGFAVLAALDIRAGRAVRLTRGVVDQANDAHAVDVAQELIAAGTHWLHVVDLDRAREVGQNDEVVAEVTAQATAAGVTVQVSGGIRDAGDVARAVGFGAHWVNVACEALLDRTHVQALVTDHGSRVSVSLDVRAHALIARGTNTDCGRLDETLDWVIDAGLSRVVVTDVDADGAMSGPNFALVDRVASRGIDVIASGGIASLEDVQALVARRNQGVIGAIIGKALYAGAFTLADAQNAAVSGLS